MADIACSVCEAPTPSARHRYCSPRCKWTAANHKRRTRAARSCPGCGSDLSDRHGRTKYCSNACRRWVANGHETLRVPATHCDQCGKAMTGKLVSAKFCTRKCKLRASENRRVRDDAARYQVERDRRILYALEYARLNPHVGQAAKVRRKAQQRDAGVFVLTGRDWRRLCARYDHRCFYCGERKPLTMDHVIPIIRGGRHSIGNIVPACASCNSSKSRRFIVEWRAKQAA